MTAPARVLIATWDGGGNTPPAFHLGARLARRGQRVRMLGWRSMANRAEKAGIEFAPFPSEKPLPTGLTQDEGWSEYVDPMLHGLSTKQDILAEATTFRPDVMVLDCMLGAGFAAARELEVPTAVLVHVLYSPFVHLWGDGVMHTSVAGLLAEASRVLALAPPGFDEPSDLPANTSYTGPITNPAPGRLPSTAFELLRAPGDPWVLISLGTTMQRQVTALPHLLTAVAEVPVRVLLTLGGVLPVGAVSAPPNVTVRGHVPHELVLPHVGLVITHGGMSTITTSLAAGVPLVCVPQGREQPINAGRVEAVGAGRVVGPEATAPEIAAAVSAVLHDQQARAVARSFGAAISALGAGESASEDVEQLAGPRRSPGPSADLWQAAHRPRGRVGGALTSTGGRDDHA
ncbi:MAG: glycosyltransferase [Candidatus Dormibacteria bacterium]